MCQRSQEALISLPLLLRSIPPFQLAPQFTFEQHIKGKQRGACAYGCVCGCTRSDKLLVQSGMPGCRMYRLRASQLISKQSSKEDYGAECILVRKTHFPFFWPRRAATRNCLILLSKWTLTERGLVCIGSLKWLPWQLTNSVLIDVWLNQCPLSLCVGQLRCSTSSVA